MLFLPIGNDINLYSFICRRYIIYYINIFIDMKTFARVRNLEIILYSSAKCNKSYLP